MATQGPSSEFFIPEKGRKVDGRGMGEMKCDSNKDPEPGLCQLRKERRASPRGWGSRPGVPELRESLVDSASL